MPVDKKDLILDSGRPKPFYQKIDGVPRCPFTTPKLLQQGLQYVAEKDDLLQVSYPKCGAHWVQYITQLILKEGEPITSHQEFMANCLFIEYVEKGENYWSGSCVRTSLTHLPLRKEKMNTEAKYVYVARNPWDCCVSLYYHVKEMSVFRFEDGTFDDFLEVFLHGDTGYGDYFEHLKAGYALRNQTNVFFLTYEDLQKDARGTVLRLARFLGERYGNMLGDGSEDSRKRLELVLKRSSAENMRKVMVFNFSEHCDPAMNERLQKLDVSCNGENGNVTKTHSFVRKGKVGSWKEHFSPKQLRRMEAVIAEKETGSEFMQLWADIREDTLRLSRKSE